MVSEGDAPLVRLPARVSGSVQAGVKAFVSQKGLRGHYRWHDADLWLVYQEQATTVPTDGGQDPVILQTRVTVAAFAGESGFQPDLVFMPDILLIAPEGRYVLPPVKRRKAQLTLTVESSLQLEELEKSVTSNLEQAWDIALSLAKEPQQADVFLGGRYTEPLDGDHGQHG